VIHFRIRNKRDFTLFPESVTLRRLNPNVQEVQFAKKDGGGGKAQPRSANKNGTGK